MTTDKEWELSAFPALPFLLCFCNGEMLQVILLHVDMGSRVCDTGLSSQATSLQPCSHTLRVNDVHIFLCLSYISAPKSRQRVDYLENGAVDRDCNRQVIIIKKELLDNWLDSWMDRCGQRSDSFFLFCKSPKIKELLHTHKSSSSGIGAKTSSHSNKIYAVKLRCPLLCIFVIFLSDMSLAITHRRRAQIVREPSRSTLHYFL